MRILPSGPVESSIGSTLASWKQPFSLRARSATARTTTADLFTCAPHGAAGSDRGPTAIVRPRASGRRTRGAVPLRPTLCQKQIAQPPLPVSLYKPLVFRRFRAGARGRRLRRRVLEPTAICAVGNGAAGQGGKSCDVRERARGMLRIRNGPGSAPTASVRSR
jgi:hypothetical protein